MNISLKHVVVTGAATGLGLAVARALVARGIAVSCVDADPVRLADGTRALAAEGGQVIGVVADVGDPASLGRAFAEIDKVPAPIDGLVTCAGVQNTTRILDLSVEEWDRVLNINLRGTFLCVQNALRAMIPRRSGRIVTIASDTAKRGGGRLGKSAYGASKGGVLLFTRSIARELAPDMHGDIRVNCLCPGPMFTHMHDGLTDDQLDMVRTSVPVGRFGTPDEVAAGVLFLLSDEASYMYGESLVVDGGVVMD